MVPGLTDAHGTFDLFAFPSQAPTGGDATPPSAARTGGFAGVSAPTAAYDFALTWTDDVALDASTIGNGDVVVTGPNGYRQAATLVTESAGAAADQVNAVYRVTGPGGLRRRRQRQLRNRSRPRRGERCRRQLRPRRARNRRRQFAVAVALGDGPDLQAVGLAGDVPASVVAGRQKVKPLKLTVTNAGNQPATGTVRLRLLASTDEIPDAGDAVVTDVPAKLKLAPGKSKVFKLKASTFPAVADGDYVLLAVIDAGGELPERIESNNAAPLATPVALPRRSPTSPSPRRR